MNKNYSASLNSASQAVLSHLKHITGQGTSDVFNMLLKIYKPRKYVQAMILVLDEEKDLNIELLQKLIKLEKMEKLIEVKND